MRPVIVEDQHVGIPNRIESTVVGDFALGRVRVAQIVEQVWSSPEQRLQAVLVAFVLDRGGKMCFAAADSACQYQPATWIGGEPPGGVGGFLEAVIAHVDEVLEVA